MARTRYCVVLHKRRWTILLNGGYYGPYATRQSAIEAAILAAQKNGRNSLVLVQGDDEKFKTVWPYGDESLLLSA
jgi:hypothetical protein